MPQAYPWRDGRTVTEVVRAHRDILIRAGILEPGPGYSAAEIKAIERRITNVPADVRKLYAAARPRQRRLSQHKTVQTRFRRSSSAGTACSMTSPIRST